MSARDELALDVLWGKRVPTGGGSDYLKLDANAAHAIADAVRAAGYRKPRTITTAEELDALRFQAVVLDAYGTPYVCERHRTDGTRNEWKPSGMNQLDDSEDILYHGPVTVVHEGEPKP